MNQLRATLFAVSIVGLLTLWFVERDLPPRPGWLEHHPSRPDFATGAVYPQKLRGGGVYYLTAEEVRVRDIRSRNRTIMIVSVVSIVFGGLPLYHLLTRSMRQQGGNVDPSN